MIEISCNTAIEAKIALEKSIAASRESVAELNARGVAQRSPELYANCLAAITENLEHYEVASREIDEALKALRGKKAIY